MAAHFFGRGSALVVLSVVLAACSSSDNGPNPAASLSSVDANFIVGATQASNAEISAAQLALQRSSNADVRDFAEEMITQHTAQEQALMPVAASVSDPAPGPTSLNPAQVQMAQTLQATPEPAFDGVYINGEIAGHTMNLTNNFNPEIASGANQAIISYARTYLPQVQMHLQMAEQIKTQDNF